MSDKLFINNILVTPRPNPTTTYVFFFHNKPYISFKKSQSALIILTVFEKDFFFFVQVNRWPESLILISKNSLEVCLTWVKCARSEQGFEKIKKNYTSNPGELGFFGDTHVFSAKHQRRKNSKENNTFFFNLIAVITKNELYL